MPTRFHLSALSVTLVLATLTGCATVPLTSTELSAVPQASTALGPADGYIPDGERVKLTDNVPAISNLSQALRDALARAAKAAASRNISITLTDGWRSEKYQQYLFERAVAKYGSEAEASRWVKRSDSKHVSGEAVDVATADAMDWLNRFGSAYGLCQIYTTEAWHFELAADRTGSCPRQLTGASG